MSTRPIVNVLQRQIVHTYARITDLQAQLAEQEAARATAEAQATELHARQNQPVEGARASNIRTHLPDKLEGRTDDWAVFIADMRSYYDFTKVPTNLRVSYAFRCLGKVPKKAWEEASAGAVVTIDVCRGSAEDALINRVEFVSCLSGPILGIIDFRH